jgi:two-component system, OmpR family, response regulator CpxR
MPRPKKLILAVDDNEQTLSIRRFLFDNAGYRVLSASSGAEALEKLTAVGPQVVDLIVTDLMMLNMDGNELIRRAKEFDPDVRTLLVSGTVANYGEAYRADAFVPKGTTVRVLLQHVKVLTGRKRGPKRQLAQVEPGTAEAVTSALQKIETAA